MKKLKTKLINCYGINNLEYEFDFENKNSYVIYSPNGTMKTSFAKTFDDYSKNIDSRDQVYIDRESIRDIFDENNVEVNKEHFFVIKSFKTYREMYTSEKQSTLLVSKELKKKYDDIHLDINKKKEDLLRDLRNISGISRNIEINIIGDLCEINNNLLEILSNLENDISNNKKNFLSKYKYKDLLDEKIITFINSKDIKEKLDKYTETYEKLISNSEIFKKDIFDNYNAYDVTENLTKNCFFKANHSVNLNYPGGKITIENAGKLKEIIDEEKKKILQDKELEKVFNELDKAINKNQRLQEFKTFINNNAEILPKYSDIDSLKKELWISYLNECYESYKVFLDTYKTSKKQIENIVKEAKKEETKWQKIIEIFKDRFTVPFTIDIKNKEDIVLGINDAPSLQFSFIENTGNTHNISQQDLQEKILSQGELNALYILNILFEIEARKDVNQKTLLIIDDIADSFDYKNKYAIIEYLRDIQEYQSFCQIILTHNFDFYRSITSRLGLKNHTGIRYNLHAIKTTNKISLCKENYQNNVFNAWIFYLNNNQYNNQHIVALIPFVRNIVEYCKGDDTEEYNKLTSLLHIKSETNNFTLKDLEKTFKQEIKRIKNEVSFQPSNKKIIDLIYETADSILSEPIMDELKLEDKIVLSIAIRLKAEQFMIDAINDPNFVNNINGGQGFKLFNKYLEMFEGEINNIRILKKVNLMTPEFIHINSFMYEPILDMSKDHLIQLYQEVKQLAVQSTKDVQLEIELEQTYETGETINLKLKTDELEDKKEEIKLFKEGDKVFHQKFGAGYIETTIKISENVIYSVIFEKAGKRALDAQTAKLTHIEMPE